MLAYHRSDVDELNQAAHALMLDQHRLGRNAVRLGEREFRVGDQVLCRRNDQPLGLRNGTRGTVIQLEQDALLVRGQAGVDRRVPSAYAAEHLDYGYALTGHAAQGLTADRAFVLLHDRGALQEWGYVACTRTRLETRLYLADRNTVERETPLREADRAAPPERAARVLQHSAAEPLALDQRRGQGDRLSVSSLGNRSNSTGNARAPQRDSQPPNTSSNSSTGGTAAAGAISKPRSLSITRRSSARTRSANN